MNTALTTAVIPLAALFIVYRQMMTRPTERPGILYVSLALVALGVLRGGVVDPQHLGVSVALVTVELFAAVAFGV
ncbi:MAG: hypothetical protein HOY71_03360, partial [Nonomuraea sp.]|nr:hypothetical protein [Nonomuraea sp.]